MSGIDEQIDQMADALEKSTKTPEENLFDTLKDLGPEGIREKLLAKSEDGSPLLSEEEKVVLKSALEEMKKGGPGSGRKGNKTSKFESLSDDQLASHYKWLTERSQDKHQTESAKNKFVNEWDAARQELTRRKNKMKKAAVTMDDAYQAKYVQGNIKDTKLQEDKADDDQDEKLVKPEAANHPHQGGSRAEGEKPWEGQVIKAKEITEDKEAKDKKQDKKIAEKVADSKIKEHNKKLHPNAPASMKKGNDMENPYEACNVALEKGDLDAAKEILQEMKKSIIEDLKEQGVEPTDELVKGKMKQSMLESQVKTRKSEEYEIDGVGQGGKINKEEDQLSDTDEATKGKDRGDKKRPKELKTEEDNKAAQDKVNDMSQGKMKKALDWDGPNALLKAGRGGQNMHFNVNTYYDNALERMEKSKDAPEILEKSDKSEEPSINNYIEKSMDASRDHLICESMIKDNQEKVNGKFVKSFEDNEIAQALGLSEEDAKKILGE